jgi:curved DNA-binding protein CbpA
MKDYYKILQIDPEASLEVMNNAYRALVRQYHPDLYHTHRKTTMNVKMQEINEAYQVLSNTVTRAEYDKKRGSTPHREQDGTLPTRSLNQTLKRILLWGIGSYLAMRFLLVPFISNPALKIMLLFAMVFGLIRLYSKRKSSP